MPFLDALKTRIGNDVYLRLEKEAEKEVALAKKMPLRGDNFTEKFYAQRALLGELLGECELFEKQGLRLLPTEIVTALFRCKLLYATKSEQEYRQRAGGWSLLDPPPYRIHWEDRNQDIEVLIERTVEDLESDIKERTLITRLDSFLSAHPENKVAIQDFLNALFSSLSIPFEAFIAEDKLIERHRTLEPRRPKHSSESASEFFQTPSVGCQIKGSREYCFWNSVFLLRTFLNLLRIGSFVHPGQIEFGREVKISPPTYPVFLGSHAEGWLQWQEDEKESWAKLPDGCLFLSFGYRGLSPVWLDRRTFSLLTHFVLSHKVIFRCLKNPWTARSINDVVPALDILSSAVQMPDLGAKILLIYTCLEHLFVPRETRNNQRLFIVGGLNALKPSLVPWFDSLFKLRCDYAHRGFVIKNQETMALVMKSVENVMGLLIAKHSIQ